MSKANAAAAKGNTETIKVVIRCRPMAKNEIKDGRECVVKMVQKTGEVLI